MSPTSHSSWQAKLACVWVGELASILTSSVLQMGFVWHIALVTNSASALSLASLAGFLPLALFGAFAGTVVDRMPLKRVLIASDLFVAAIAALVALVSLVAKVEVWMIIVALFMRAVGTAFYNPASQALTPQLAPPEHLVRLAGVTQAMQSVGYILGVALAAVIYPLWGLTAMVALDVVGALLASAGVLIAHIDTSRRVAPVPSGSIGELIGSISLQTREGYRVMRSHEGLFALAWFGFAFTLVFAPVAALFPFMTLEYFGAGTDAAAVVEVVFSVGMIVGSALLAVTGGFKNPILTMLSALVAFGAAALVCGLVDKEGLIVFLCMSFIMGLSSPFYSGPQVALLQEGIEPEYLGRVFGLYGTIMSWALPIGLIVPTLLADSIGVTTCFLVSGLLMVALAVAMWVHPVVRSLGNVASRVST